MTLAPLPFSTAPQRSLVVLLHAFRHTPARLKWVKRAVLDAKPEAHVLAPSLPLSMWSMADLTDVSADVVSLIDGQVEYREKQGWAAFDEIVLVGHSTGSMISRKAYILSCGETPDAPFQHRALSDPRPLAPRRSWAPQVKRIIQLAGMNGGWSVSHHMGLRRSLEFSVGSAFGHVISMFSDRSLAIFQIRRGAPFLSSLRLEWLAMLGQAKKEGLETATVVQLLGTVDDLVAPEDNLDVVTGNEFLYLDVPETGHVEVIRMDETRVGVIRRAIFQLALRGDHDEIRAQSVVPSDPDLKARNNADFTDVVFVIHGIRDTGYWTHKIARKVQVKGRESTPARKFATETSTYGYFPMLAFLLPWCRFDKVAWLMDRYVWAKSLYPNARFSYVGHSHGTYLLASALQSNPACRFENVVFAGSVVRRDYDWELAAGRGQVASVLNYVASSDKVVAWFPGALEQFKLQDLGTAGHNGFDQFERIPGGKVLHEVRYVKGGHGAALAEEHWDRIARFVCTGTPPPRPDPQIQQSRLTVVLGRAPWVVWILLLATLGSLTGLILRIPELGWRTAILIAFWWAVLKILTRF